MRNKILSLSIAFTALFSYHSYSQTTKDTDHPLLDKYYPRAKVDTPKAVIAETKPLPQINKASEIKPDVKTSQAPVATDKIAINKPITTTLPPPETKLSSETIPASTLTDTTAINKPGNIIAPPTQLISQIPLPVAADTTASIKPVDTPITVPVPAQQKVVAKPSETPYMDTRLGSSTQAYDTWKKNNNGAGSVTTSAK